MPTGILAVWSDVDAAGEDDYNAWYDREHLFERLEVPGFHRGRHYLTVSGAPRYFRISSLTMPRSWQARPIWCRPASPRPGPDAS